MKQQRESLPIFKLRETLLEAFAKYQVLVVIGETGCAGFRVSGSAPSSPGP